MFKSSFLHGSAVRCLHVEPLEQRALLTGLIAAVDIAPGPVEEFAVQAKSFIESALDQVMQTQHQTPIGSTVESTQEFTRDGSLVQITNYTIDLTSNSHSQLVFSFEIFPDNSVSVRARLTNPQLASFTTRGSQVVRNLPGASDQAFDHSSVDDRNASDLIRENHREDLPENVLSRTGTPPEETGTFPNALEREQVSHSGLDLELRVSQESERDWSSEFGAETNPSLCFSSETLSSLDPSESQANGMRRPWTPSSMLTGGKDGRNVGDKSHFDAVALIPAARTLSMIRLDFNSELTPNIDRFTDVRSETFSSSALYQVFLHSSNDEYFAEADQSLALDYAMPGAYADESAESQFDPWQRTSIALLALAVGVFLGVPPRQFRQRNPNSKSLLKMRNG